MNSSRESWRPLVSWLLLAGLALPLIYRKVGQAEINDYFVPGLGFVRRNAKEGNKWELKEYSGLKPIEAPGK